MAIPYIGRRTSPEMPRYREADDDVFTINLDELVPAARNTGASESAGGTSNRVVGNWVDDRFTIGEYLVQRYRRRIEARHDRIERWHHQPSGQTHWRVTDADNVTSLFGATDESRESDPSASTKISRWLLTERYDDRGNIVRYTYKRENLDNVDVEAGVERHRKDKGDAQGGARYIKRIEYGNAAPHDRAEWRYQVVFDYGEHDDDLPGVNETGLWTVRPDSFSDNRAGFEKRMWRRCKRVLMFHEFEDLGNTPVLVSAVELTHDDGAGRSLLTKLVHKGYIVRDDGSVQTRSQPAVEFGYQSPDFDDTVHSLDTDVVVGALLDERSGARWIDLLDEALPGLAMRVGGTWCFVRNFGGGLFGEPEAVADPDLLEPDDPEEIDLTNPNEPDIGPAHNREYQPTTTMRATANINQDDPYVGYLDLNGDLADDVVVADDRVIRWYPSQGDAGFGDPIVLKLDASGPVRPACLHADQRQSLWVADMTGDGLYDIVRIRSGEVSYWPHLGRGRFGDRVNMDSSPAMPASDAGVRHLLLGDLTASGTADLIWVDSGEIRYWENLNGARFGTPRRASAPGIAPGGPGVATVDVFGRGADCVVWVDQSSGAPTLRYISPVGERRPHLLARVNNGRGGETRCAYVSTAELRRRDRDAGRDQLTSLGVPVQVVERTEHRDEASGTRDLCRFVFRHGAYDEATRAFIGFAYREEWRSGPQELYDQPGLFAHEPAIGTEAHKRAVPTLSKTWTHTGVLFEGEDLAVELTMEYFADPQRHKRSWFGGNQVPITERGRDSLDSHAAMRGRLIRSELYDVANGTATVPLTVHEYTSSVRQVQPSRNGLPGSYDACALECVSVQYDAEGKDPRFEHRIVLSVDPYGSELRSATVAYARAQPAVAGQGVSHVSIVETSVINRVDQATWYRIRLPMERTTWQASGLIGPIGELYERGEIARQFNDLEVVTPGVSATGPHRRVVERERTRYWTNDLTSVLDLGDVESKAPVARTDRLALSDAMVRQLFDERDVADILRYEGGYEHDDGLWWVTGSTIVYSRANFYLPVARRDAVGRQVIIRYNSGGLAVAETEDATGNVERYVSHSRTGRVWQLIDVNNNVIADRFDPLGNLLSRAVMGKLDQTQGDVLALDVKEASARDDPTMVVTYGAFDRQTQTPSYVRLRRRVEHRGEKANLVDSFTYFDSEGRRLACSSRSGEGPWRIEDYSALDSCGNAVVVAQPFLSDTPWPTQDRANEALSTSFAFRVDALGRVVRVDSPNGTYVTSEFSPWVVTESDANDNILDTTWYAERHGAMQGRAADFAARAIQQYESRAAAIAAVHANAPTQLSLDAVGRVIARRRITSAQESITHRFDYDTCSDLTNITDARGLTHKRISRDLLGRVVRVDHADAGVVQYLLAATGETLRQWDPLGRLTRYRYDANGRKTHAYFNSGVGRESLIERVVWGGGEVFVPDAQERNLVDVAHLMLSSGGVTVVDDCDWNGNVTRTSMRTAINYEQSADWSLAGEAIDVAGMMRVLEQAQPPVLNDSAWTTQLKYDALGRIISRDSCDVGKLSYEYGSSLQLERVRLQLEDAHESVLLDELRYDSAGRPSLLRFGNGAWVRRHYNPAGRVAHIVAAARGNDAPLQNLSIAYDPNGNVTIVGEGSELVAAYGYDGADRLIRAEGRQTIGDSESREGPTFLDTYALDSEGNILEYRHKSGSVDTATAYDYQSGRNQLRAASRQEIEAEPFNSTYQYDNGGNLIHAPDHRSYRWNQSNQLSRIELGDGTLVYFGYALDGSLMRRVIVRKAGEIREEVVSGEFERVWQLNGHWAEIDRRVFVRVGDTPLALVTRQLNAGTDVVNVRFQLVDQINSAVMELDEAGRVVEQRSYSAFGQTKTSNDDGVVTFGFAGAHYDSQIPLYRLRSSAARPPAYRRSSPSAGRLRRPGSQLLGRAELAGLGSLGRLRLSADPLDNRWYDPEVGRYIQPPTSLDDSTNAYLFKGANPQSPD